VRMRWRRGQEGAESVIMTKVSSSRTSQRMMRPARRQRSDRLCFERLFKEANGRGRIGDDEVRGGAV